MPEMLKMTCFRGFSGAEATIVGPLRQTPDSTRPSYQGLPDGHDGLARTVFPAHTQYDGDTIFALSCGDLEGPELSMVGALAVLAASEAILRAVRKAESVGGIPAYADLKR